MPRLAYLVRCFPLISLATLALAAGNQAVAQYGSQPMGTILSAPQGMHHAVPAYRGAHQRGQYYVQYPRRSRGPDPYDPAVWQAKRGRSLGFQRPRPSGLPEGFRLFGSQRSASRPHGAQTPKVTLGRSQGGSPRVAQQPVDEGPRFDGTAPSVEEGELVAPLAEEVLPEEDGVLYGPDEYGEYPDEVGEFGDVSGCDGCADGCNQCRNWPFSRLETQEDYVCLPGPCVADVQVHLGVQGYKGPAALVDRGSFGFHQAVSLGGPIRALRFWDIGYQIGFRATQSDLSGTPDSGAGREQFFFTAGLFHPAVHGWQWGVVWDYFRDDIVVADDEVELGQVRTEVSYLYRPTSDVGFLGMFGTRDDTINGFNQVWEVNDQVLGFHRWYFEGGAQARLWAGFSGSEDAIFGGDASVPLTDSLALNTNFNYLIPDLDAGRAASAAETWNVAVSMVWHFGGRARGNKYRPLLEVADNGSFFSNIQ